MGGFRPFADTRANGEVAPKAGIQVSVLFVSADSSVSVASGSSLMIAMPVLLWARMQRARGGRLSNGTPDRRPATRSDGSGATPQIG
jgi:hypothetical protein